MRFCGNPRPNIYLQNDKVPVIPDFTHHPTQIVLHTMLIEPEDGLIQKWTKFDLGSMWDTNDNSSHL